MKGYERFIEAHPEVKAWLQNRPFNTRRQFAGQLQKFCKEIKLSPIEWRKLPTFEARDLAWKFVQTLSPSVTKSYLITLKSWYRNLNGEQLPFDSTRGGKHYVRAKHSRAAVEHIPNKTEMYQIIDMAGSLRDKAILLFLFQSGCRVNVLEHITYGDIADQLNEDIITLKITGDLDHKLRNRDIPFYYTFMNGEGAETLRQFCKLDHKNSKPETPLFATRGHKYVNQRWIWTIVKMCSQRAGFDPTTISTHTIRKAFRKIVRQTNIDDDDKEQLMGHVIRQARQSYYDTHDVELIRKAYEKCNFTREIPESNHTKMKREIEELSTKVKDLEAQRVTVTTPQFESALAELPKEQLIAIAQNFQKMIEKALEKK
jgi:integrase